MSSSVTKAESVSELAASSFIQASSVASRATCQLTAAGAGPALTLVGEPMSSSGSGSGPVTSRKAALTKVTKTGEDEKGMISPEDL